MLRNSYGGGGCVYVGDFLCMCVCAMDRNVIRDKKCGKRSVRPLLSLSLSLSLSTCGVHQHGLEPAVAPELAEKY